MGWKDVSYMGSEYYETPNIDKLAEGGMYFTQAYAIAANCASIRSSLLSSQYMHCHGVFTVGNPNRGNARQCRLVAHENSESISLSCITSKTI